jgi:L-ascorbate metabolism protein UlaG (beta-lactamase superfamily)
MCRTLAALTVLLASAAAAPAAGKVTIRWHGQSFFEVQSAQGVRVVLDPHSLDAFGRNVVQADVVLMSHLHPDHVQVGVVENLKQAKVIPGLKDLKGDGKRVEWNNVDETVKDVHIRSVGTFHDNKGGLERGKNTVFVLEMDGLRIVHLGDLGHKLTDDQVKRIGPVDVVMVPVGGVYTLNGTDASEVVDQLRPRRYIIPMHYAVDAYEDVLKPDEFLEEQKDRPIKKLDTNLLEIDPKERAPREPTVAVLYWDKARKTDK